MFLSKILKPMAAAVVAASMAGVARAEGYWQGMQAAGALRCGAAVAPPYVMRDPASGEYSGFFAELCRELATTLG